MLKPILAISMAVALLSGCGGSGSQTEQPSPPPQPPAPPQVPTINSARAIQGSLAQVGASSFERYLKNGVFSASSADSSKEVGTTSSDFSQTNTAEVGVDEADRVEYDGDFMYLATHPIWGEQDNSPAAVRIMQRNEDFSLTQVNRLEVEPEHAIVNGIYLYQDRLSVLASDYPFMTLFDIASTSLSLAEGEPTHTIDLQIFDTSNPAEASLQADIAIEGWLVASRRLDNYVYLVSSYRPWVELPHVDPESDAQRLENYQYLQNLDMASLMPTIAVDGSVSNLNQPQDCFIPSQVTEQDGYDQLLTITRINVQQTDDIQSVCVGAYADTSYMSTDSLVLTAYSDQGDTIVHKFDVADPFTYAASGAVAGQLGGDNLRMSESDGYLRLVTTAWDTEGDAGPTHRLFVLAQAGDELEVVAQLPNAQQTAAIGKPNEDIFAVRFIQDKAYIVTFERTDPLYVVDLSDNTAPFIAGELTIPGFSSYLHPMENGYLLGVGQEVELQQFPRDGGGVIELPVSTGVKISLFDVADPSNPRQVAQQSFDGTYTPVEYDYRALSVLKTEQQYRFAMPLEGFVETELDNNDNQTTAANDLAVSSTIWTPQNSLLMFSVNAARDAGEMQVVNRMVIDTQDTLSYIWSGDDRSVIHGDYVFYIHGNQVWQSTWELDAAVNGPF